MMTDDPRAASAEKPAVTRITERDVSESSATDTSLAQSGAIERQEHAADVARMRAVLVVALPMWVACVVVDWSIVRFIEKTDIAYFWSLRGIHTVVIALALARLLRAPDPSPGALRFLDMAVYAGGTAIISLMSLRYLGITSPYAAAV